MHITLYRKYRPSSFSEVSGENEIVKSLKLSLKNKSMAHAYLFSGPRGVGKTTVARLIAKGVNCLNLKENGEPCNECKNCKAINEGRFSDLIEIDAASNRSIDEIRSLKEKINYQPVEGLKKVYIIDEAHMLTKEAFNALLKTLEEPPAHVIFILATTELEKILPTIISRCQRYDFKPLDLEEMKSGLEHILKEEKLSMTDDVYPVIYENASGSMRDSISILERLIVTANGKEIDLKIAEDTLGITPSSRIKIFLNKILNENEYDIINELESLANESFDIELFFKDLAKYCKNAILKKELDIDKGLKIISTIYDVIGKFKFEDDKKLVGYVIVAEILSNTKQTVVKVVTTTQTNVNYPNSSIEEKPKDKEKVNELKLRLGYGEVGNVNGLGDYLFLTNYTRSQDGASYQLGDAFYQTYRPGVTNKNLRWEIGNTLNAGIDFGFLDNLITGTLDVYRKQTKDLIAETTIDPFTNFKNRVNANVGDMENKGIELGLTITLIRNIEKNIRWSFNYNISYNENKITKMPDDQPAGGISGGTGNRVQLHREGETPYSFFVYQQVYDAQGNPVENAFVDRNGNGKIDEGDRYLYKSPFAPVTMGFGTDLNYKNWDLNITTRANIGNYVYNNTQSRLDQFGEITANSGFLRNIKANSNFQRHNDQSWLSDYYLENASFFKLDNITLGYTFPHTDKMYIRLYGTVQNVLTITKYSGLDPEALSVDSATNRATFGIDNNLYPRPQTYLLGLNVNF